MADLNFSADIRNAILDAIETAVGTAPILKLFTGAKPANCAAADSGTLLVQGAVPSDWLAAASAGAKDKAGTWTFTAEAAIGTQDAGYFRMYNSDSPTQCKIQGSVTVTAGGGSMTMASVSITQAQTVTVDTFQFTAGNAS